MSFSKKDLLTSSYFSDAGKLSLNYYNITNQINKLKRKPHKTESKYFICPNYVLPTYDEGNSANYGTNFRFKKIIAEDKNQNDNITNSTIEENENEGKKLFEGENYKYYNLHKDRVRLDKKYGAKKNKIEEPYTPDFFSINNYYFPKKKSGLDWKYLTGREEKKLIQDKKDIKSEFIYDIKQKLNNNCFIDMSKQTERKGLPLNNNMRQRFEKKYIPLNSQLEKKKWLKFCKRPLIAISPFSNNTYGIFGYRRDISPNITKIKLKKILLSSKSSSKNKKSNLYFGKSLNKKNLVKNLSNYKQTPISVLYPKYNSIEERIKMMVTYNSQKSIKKKNKIKELKGISLSDLYDASKSFEKIHANKLGLVPNFEKMISRPKDDKLPTFMKGIYNGMNFYINTDKSLLSNDYSNKMEYYYNCNKGGKSLRNKFLKNKGSKSTKDISKDILKKFNKLYVNFYKSLKKINKNDIKKINN